MNTTIQIALAASLALAGPALADDATASGTQTQDQDQEQVRARVHRELTTRGEVSEQDAETVDGEVNDHAGTHGYGPALQQAIRDAHAQGCTGQCQVELIHAINHALDQGATPDAAAKTATRKVASASGKPTDPQARSADHRRDAARRDMAADRVHDRTHDRGQAGSHAMGAGHR
jgi:hypothetical protein